MAYLLTELESGWEVDSAILAEEARLVIIRFGLSDSDECKLQDETLLKIEDEIKNLAIVYIVDI
jgi:DIM1 family U5 snRNP protein